MIHHLPTFEARPKRSYSAEEKAAALAAVISCRGRVREAARATGIPRRTLGYWSKGKGITPEVLRHMDEARRTLRDKLMREAVEAADTLPAKRDAAGYKDTLVGIGIAVDKAQLLDGQPTQITAHAETQVRGAFVMLVERFGREPWEAAAIISDKRGVPLEEVKQIVAALPPPV